LSSDESVEAGNDEAESAVLDDCGRNACTGETPKVKVSQIPIPIRPALNKPKHPRHPFPTFKQPTSALLNGSKSNCDRELLMEIPNYDGESLTSSSDSSDRGRTRMPTLLLNNNQQKATILKNDTLQDLARMRINDKLVLENLFRKVSLLYKAYR
jgi:hypothetical protein